MTGPDHKAAPNVKMTTRTPKQGKFLLSEPNGQQDSPFLQAICIENLSKGPVSVVEHRQAALSPIWLGTRAAGKGPGVLQEGGESESSTNNHRERVK